MKRASAPKTPKSTAEIWALIKSVNMDFESVVNKALNDYLPKIFISCPFTDELCIHRKQCIGCTSFDKEITIKQ
ncbi:MAG: hypothetical protein ACQCN6_04960 [Candidatus Bathyarchaeia archaeon]|jgi:hypothetical protein